MSEIFFLGLSKEQPEPARLHRLHMKHSNPMGDGGCGWSVPRIRLGWLGRAALLWLSGLLWRKPNQVGLVFVMFVLYLFLLPSIGDQRVLAALRPCVRLLNLPEALFLFGFWLASFLSCLNRFALPVPYQTCGPCRSGGSISMATPPAGPHRRPGKRRCATPTGHRNHCLAQSCCCINPQSLKCVDGFISSDALVFPLFSLRSLKLQRGPGVGDEDALSLRAVLSIFWFSVCCRLLLLICIFRFFLFVIWSWFHRSTAQDFSSRQCSQYSFFFLRSEPDAVCYNLLQVTSPSPWSSFFVAGLWRCFPLKVNMYLYVYISHLSLRFYAVSIDPCIWRYIYILFFTYIHILKYTHIGIYIYIYNTPLNSSRKLGYPSHV